MSITCFIRYQIDPFQREAFAEYARNWAASFRAVAATSSAISCRTRAPTMLRGPHRFASLAAYEAYRARLAVDPAGAGNFAFARASASSCAKSARSRKRCREMIGRRGAGTSQASSRGSSRRSTPIAA